MGEQRRGLCSVAPVMQRSRVDASAATLWRAAINELHSAHQLLRSLAAPIFNRRVHLHVTHTLTSALTNFFSVTKARLHL